MTEDEQLEAEVKRLRLLKERQRLKQEMFGDKGDVVDVKARFVDKAPWYAGAGIGIAFVLLKVVPWALKDFPEEPLKEFLGTLTHPVFWTILIGAFVVPPLWRRAVKKDGKTDAAVE